MNMDFNARRTIEEQYAISIIADRYVDLCRKLIEGGREK